MAVSRTALGERLISFVAQAPETTTKTALANALLRLIGPLGARSYACLYLRRDLGGYVIERSVSNLPRAWQQLYLDRGYDATDHIFQSAVRGGACGFWSEQTRNQKLDPGGREVMAAARAFNMKEGFTKRVMLDQGSIAVMMAAGEDLARDASARAAFRISFDVFANEAARFLKMPVDVAGLVRGGISLSKAQFRVLVLRAEGLSNREIADTTGRREKTVESHVTEILKRLNARNMIDAVRIATRLRILM
ncbi:MAG: autoinducer binding domain-containing protein [Alphaproteobacteria bacterium]|nr:autoinducer binding domain-containing protein [Alphaproteobacteria bacterium]